MLFDNGREDSVNRQERIRLTGNLNGHSFCTDAGYPRCNNAVSRIDFINSIENLEGC